MMRRRGLLVVGMVLTVIGLAAFALMQAPPAGAEEPSPASVPGELIISYQPGVTDEQIEEVHKKYNLKEKEHLNRGRAGSRGKSERVKVTLVSVAGGVNKGLIKRLERDPRIKYAERNYILTADLTPNDPQFSLLWGLNNTGQTGGTVDADIDAPEAWELTTGSSSVIVGVIDSGLAYNHEDLTGNVWTNPGEIAGNGIDDDGNGYIDDIHGINAITNSGDPQDDNGHGTHVSGTIGARGNNSVGVVGVNWQVSIASCKFLNAAGSGSTANAIKCFVYFNQLKHEQGVNVRATNSSWGGGGFSLALRDTMAGLDQPGMAPILHVAAAGNGNNNNDASPIYPAAYTLDNLISVASTDDDDIYAGNSNYGATSVDLAGPGVSILSTYIPNTYANLSGTSMASPHVAGAAALAWSLFPALSAVQMKQLILSNVDDIGSIGGNPSKPTLTNGRLNLAKVLANDSTPPDDVSDLAASAATLLSLTVGWTAVGDDGLVGQATSYDVRYSTSPISELNWPSATQATGEPSPQPIGSPETFTIPGLNHSSTYYVGLKVTDEIGNQSGLSNHLQADTRDGSVAFQDDMESGSGGWTTAGTPGLWHLSSNRFNSPTMSWYYGQEGILTYNTGATNDGTLTSETIVMPEGVEAILLFSEFADVESLASFDRTRVQASTDNVNWVTVFESHGTSDAWVDRTVDMTAYLNGNLYLRYWFDTLDNIFNDFEGWYVDDVQILVAGANSPPTATNDAYGTSEDTPLVVPAAGVLGNDTDPDGDSLTAAVAVGPASGSLGLNPDGSFTYTPNADFNGLDSFTYRSNDGFADSNLATVSITVSPVNDAPVANDDAYSTDEDTPLVVAAAGVLVNDIDIDGDSLTAVLEVGTTNGTLSLNPDGSLTYTPGAGFNGPDSFTYTANDASLSSNIATVSITVNPVNGAPVATDDAYGTSEDTPLVVPAAGVLGNDTDPDGDSLTAAVAVGPASGSLGLNPDGSFTYTPNADFNGLDSFTYRSNDGFADSNLATVSITVSPVNDAPVANDDAYSTDEDTPLVVAAAGVLVNDIDIDGDSLTAVLEVGTTNGTLSLNPDGSLTYTPGAGFNGPDSFTYTANDASLSSNIATVSITVNPVNGAPVATDDAYGTSEDTVLVVAASGVLGNDTDPEGDPLTAAVAVGPASGSLILNPDGSFIYTPDADFNGADSFTYTANDASLGSNIATVSITVNPVNDAPVATDDAYAIDEDTPLVVAAPGVLLNDTDVDGDSLTAVLDVGTTNGTLTLNGDGSFTYAPDADFNGGDSFTYHANDGPLDGNVATVSITVNPVNDPPTADHGGPYSGGVGVTLTFDGSGSSDPEGDALTYTWDFGDSATGAGISPSHTYAAAGSYTATLTVNDGNVDSAPVSTSVVIEVPPPAGSMHVHDLDAVSVKLSKGNWKSLVTIDVRDAGDVLPVIGAIVTGTFFQVGSPIITLTCTTVASGRCAIDSGQFPSKSGSGKSFTVNNVTHASFTYASGANHDPDGDSNGTTIALSK